MPAPASPVYLIVTLHDPDGPVGLHGWSPTYFDSRFRSPTEGWAGRAFHVARFLHAPDWAREGLMALGATPGDLVGPLAWVDPWLAAAAASADHRWHDEARRERWQRMREELPFESWGTQRAALAQGAPEADHVALLQAHYPDHEATQLVELDALDARTWAASGRGERLRFLAESERPAHARAVAASLLGPLGGHPVSAEERRWVDALLGHEDPVVRGAAALLAALDAAGPEGVPAGAGGLDVLEEAAEACRATMNGFRRTRHADGSTSGRVETVEDLWCLQLIETWGCLRDQLPPGPVDTWHDAVRAAARACAAELPAGGWGWWTGSFDGERWAWEGEDPIRTCLEGASFAVRPDAPVRVHLEVHDERGATLLR